MGPKRLTLATRAEAGVARHRKVTAAAKAVDN